MHLNIRLSPSVSSWNVKDVGWQWTLQGKTVMAACRVEQKVKFVCEMTRIVAALQPEESFAAAIIDVSVC